MRRATTFAIAVLLLFCAMAMQARAATITVTNTNDSGAGSLRQALANANDGDTINFAVTGTIGLTSDELVLDKSIIISGPGASMLTVARTQGAPNFRIFHVAPNRAVTIQGLTITNGYTNDSPVSGGGIYNDHSNVTLNRCVVTDNSARGTGGFSGGGIGNYGGFSGSASLTINDSIISNNNVSDGITSNVGGAIYNYGIQGSAILTINNSTISGNQAFQGGGLFTDGGVTGSIATVTINNSTFSGNYGDQYAGGIMNEANEGGQATVTVTNSTFADNASCNCNFFAGAIFNDGNTQPGGAMLEMGNTIFKGGLKNPRNIFNQGGVVISDGNNLTNDAGVFNTNGGIGDFNAAGDQINTDPMLGPLQDNGGLTPTHELLPGSPAINAGNPKFTPPPFFDQRGIGFDRVVSDRIDIGSFEVQGPTPPPTPTPTPTSPPCSVSTDTCGSIVTIPPTDFTLNVSEPVDPATVDASDFAVNGIPANSFIVINGNFAVEFHYNTSPAVPGVNTIHISAGAFGCGPVVDFNCTFRLNTPRAIPTPRPRPTPLPRPTPP